MSIQNLVTIATYSQPVQAYLAKTKLQSEGIDSVVTNEYIVTKNWLLSNAVGGVRLQVRESDAKEAARILDHPAPDNSLKSLAVSTVQNVIQSMFIT